MRLRFLIFFLFICLWYALPRTFSVANEQPTTTRYAPGQRFVSQQADESDSSRDVTVELVTNVNIPPFINYHITLIADKCTNSSSNSNTVHVYSYNSAYNKKNKLSPNYIIDFSPWRKKKVKFKPCNMAPLCEEDSCFIKGYSAKYGEESWTQTFDIPVIEWEPFTVRTNNAVDTYLNISTKGPNCQAQGKRPLSTNNQSVCIEPFAWRPNGLTSIPLKL